MCVSLPEVPLRLASVLAVREEGSDRFFASLADKVVSRFGGKSDVHGTWTFTAATGASLAAYEIFRLSKEAAVVVVVTGEVEAHGPSSGALSDRALSACQVLERAGSYVCEATQRIARDGLPTNFWLHDVHLVTIEQRGAEHLYLLTRGVEEPDISSIGPRGTNLPKPPISFLGRSEEINEVAELLSRWFIVTIAGAPGSGKSALAAAVARNVQTEYDHGIYWVNAADCKTGLELMEKIHRATWPGRLEQPETLSALAYRLRTLSAVIILDNCESIVDDLRGIARALVEDTTTLGLLVTSTTALHVAKEHTYYIPPLSMPVPGVEIQAMRSYSSDAFGLFAERAQAAQPAFTLTVDNVGLVGEICRFVGGHPLAIEIIASRLSSRTLRSLRGQLPKLLGFRADAPARPHHSTLRAAFAHSVNAATTEQRELLLKLSFFSESFTYEMALAIWPEGVDELSMADGLDQLHRRSLLSFDLESGRYAIPPLLRIYVLEVREALHDLAELKFRFCSRMFDRVDEMKKLFAEKRENEATNLLEPFYPDVEAAIEMSLLMESLHDRYVELFAGLPYYWLRKSLLENVDPLLYAVLNHVERNSRLGADLLVLLGASHVLRGAFAEAEASMLESMAIATAIGYQRGVSRVHGNLANLYADNEKFEAAIHHADLAAALATTDGPFDDLRMLNLLMQSATLRIEWVASGEASNDADALLDAAHSALCKVEALVAQGGTPLYGHMVNSSFGEIARLRGEDQEAKRQFSLAAIKCEEAGIDHQVVSELERLAGVHFRLSEYTQSAKVLGLAISLRVRSERPRRRLQQIEFDRLVTDLQQALGDRMDEFLRYGASLGIRDVCEP